MIHLTLAIADFMTILMVAALGAMGWIAAGVAAIGLGAWGTWRIARGLHARHRR